jgi:hypothetical protein
MGRSGMGLLGEYTGLALQRWPPAGLYQRYHRSRATDRTKWAWTNYLLPIDPRGDFPPAHHRDGSPGKVVRHSTYWATRPFGGAGLVGSGLVAGLGAAGSRRTKR